MIKIFHTLYMPLHPLLHNTGENIATCANTVELVYSGHHGNSTSGHYRQLADLSRSIRFLYLKAVDNL